MNRKNLIILAIFLVVVVFFILSEKTPAFMAEMKRILSEDQRTTAFRPWESITSSISWAFIAAIFLALLMITHNLIFLPFMLILPLYLTFLFWQSRNKKTFIVYCLLSIAYSLFLSAFFWIPALIEK